MDIRVKATDYQMTAEVSDYLGERIATIEKLLGDDAPVARCEVEVGRDAGNQRHGEHVWFAEFTVNYPGGDTVRATNRAETVNAAIDDAKEETVRQLRKQRRAHTRFLRKSGAALKRLMRLAD